MEYRGEQPGIEYRLSDYVICQEVTDGKLFYSSLTGALILVRSLPESRAFLINERILVPENEDERYFVDLTRKKCQTAPYENQPCRDFWILTTTSCNANCFYCFEKGYCQQSMTNLTATQTAHFITDICDPNIITLHWYGGEPLVNIRAIDTICKILKDSNKQFQSEITSNGFLLTPDLIHRSLQDWNLNKVIITIDGTETVYNQTKAYAHIGNANPYEVVMTNVDTLVKNGVNLIIRTNIGPFNMYNVSKLYKELADRYLSKENVTVYPHMISNPPGGKIEIDSIQRKEIYNIIRAIKAPWKKRKSKVVIYDLPGFNSGRGLEFTGKQLVIKPDGELAVHPDLFKDDHFGSVYSGFKIDKKRLSQYLLEKEKAVICDHCPIYPTCFKRKLAFNATICTPADLDKCIDTSRRNVQYLFEAIKALQ